MCSYVVLLLLFACFVVLVGIDFFLGFVWVCSGFGSLLIALVPYYLPKVYCFVISLRLLFGFGTLFGMGLIIGFCWCDLVCLGLII